MTYQQLLTKIAHWVGVLDHSNWECRIKALETRNAANVLCCESTKARISALENSGCYGCIGNASEFINGAAIVAKTTDPVVSIVITGIVDIMGCALFYANPPVDPNNYEDAHIMSFSREVIAGNTYLKFYISGNIVDATYWIKYLYAYSA